jgi:hypothetical protein
MADVADGAPRGRPELAVTFLQLPRPPASCIVGAGPIKPARSFDSARQHHAKYSHRCCPA